MLEGASLHASTPIFAVTDKVLGAVRDITMEN